MSGPQAVTCLGLGLRLMLLAAPGTPGTIPVPFLASDAKYFCQAAWNHPLPCLMQTMHSPKGTLTTAYRLQMEAELEGPQTEHKKRCSY